VTSCHRALVQTHEERGNLEPHTLTVTPQTMQQLAFMVLSHEPLTMRVSSNWMQDIPAAHTHTHTPHTHTHTHTVHTHHSFHILMYTWCYYISSQSILHTNNLAQFKRNDWGEQPCIDQTCHLKVFKSPSMA